jgi:NADH-quinone oxidoreductase subunit F
MGRFDRFTIEDYQAGVRWTQFKNAPVGETFRGDPGVPEDGTAIVGVFDCPTVVNNVETISALPWIMHNGADAYAAIGTEKSKGTMLFSISGMVERPGVYEGAFGVNLWQFIEKSTGGVRAAELRP